MGPTAPVVALRPLLLGAVLKLKPCEEMHAVVDAGARGRLARQKVPLPPLGAGRLGGAFAGNKTATDLKHRVGHVHGFQRRNLRSSAQQLLELVQQVLVIGVALLPRRQRPIQIRIAQLPDQVKEARASDRSST